jgi:hypothetical protein
METVEKELNIEEAQQMLEKAKEVQRNKAISEINAILDKYKVNIKVINTLENDRVISRIVID